LLPRGLGFCADAGGLFPPRLAFSSSRAGVSELIPMTLDTASLNWKLLRFPFLVGETLAYFSRRVRGKSIGLEIPSFSLLLESPKKTEKFT
jgi:hypothetical protein